MRLMTWRALSISPCIQATFYEFKRPHASSAAHVAEVDASDPDQVEAAAAAAEARRCKLNLRNPCWTYETHVEPKKPMLDL